MKNKNTISTLLQIAETLGWKVSPMHFANGVSRFKFRRYSPAGRDFSIIIDAITINDTVKSPEVLIDGLVNYIKGFDPCEEAIKWCGPDGHGRNGAPNKLTDIIADMEDCKQMMETLLHGWTQKKETDKIPFRTVIIVQVDGLYDPSRIDEAAAKEYAATKAINDALSHIHTIEEGLEITEIVNCGESI